MSLLNGLKDAMINPLYDAVNESDMDAEFEFEAALEAVVDKQIELSEADYAAIMDDENPDNIAADLGPKDESVSKIANDAIDDDMKALESMLDELLATESEDVIQEEAPGADPKSVEGCNTGCGTKATEMDDDDSEYDEDDTDDEFISLDSLLNSIFEN